MESVEVKITIFPLDPFRDLLVYYMGEEGYDGFQMDDQGFSAYIAKESFSEHGLKDLLRAMEGKAELSWDVNLLPDINWNEEWEANFTPVEISSRIRIRAPFHAPSPQHELEVIIAPKMSFGTGHHPTTSLMAGALEHLDVQNKSVLDMGSGTAVLAILAEKMGASACTAIDFDEWCYHNAIENTELNSCQRIKVLLGDASLLRGPEYHLILANINRNVLLQDMPAYEKVLLPGGILLMSGFIQNDALHIEQLAASLELEPLLKQQKDDWMMVGFTKKD